MCLEDLAAGQPLLTVTVIVLVRGTPFVGVKEMAMLTVSFFSLFRAVAADFVGRIVTLTSPGPAVVRDTREA
jgi:hypothetical protein